MFVCSFWSEALDADGSVYSTWIVCLCSSSPCLCIVVKLL